MATTIVRLPTAGLLLSGLMLGACASTGSQPTAQQDVPEIRPGILQGYLPMDRPIESVRFVPPAPSSGTAAQRYDDAVTEFSLGLQGTARWRQAAKDADLSFPNSARNFACAVGLPITEEDTPNLYLLLRRSMADVGLATYSAKNTYQRKRPFMVNDKPICTPDEEEFLRKDGSYPSGHASVGWGWALILADVVPDRAETIMARGRTFGESRVVCNVHWYSDVVAGRMVGATAYALLQDNEEYLAAVELAREDVKQGTAAGLEPDVDCAAQASALADRIQ